MNEQISGALAWDELVSQENLDIEEEAAFYMYLRGSGYPAEAVRAMTLADMERHYARWNQRNLEVKECPPKH